MEWPLCYAIHNDVGLQYSSSMLSQITETQCHLVYIASWRGFNYSSQHKKAHIPWHLQTAILLGNSSKDAFHHSLFSGFAAVSVKKKNIDNFKDTQGLDKAYSSTNRTVIWQVETKILPSTTSKLFLLHTNKKIVYEKKLRDNCKCNESGASR